MPITCSTDAAELAEARRLAQEMDRRDVDALSQEPAGLVFFDQRQVETLRRTGSPAINALARVASNPERPIRSRVGAVVALLALEAPGSVELFDQLAGRIETAESAEEFLSSASYAIQNLRTEHAKRARDSILLRERLLTWLNNPKIRTQAAIWCDLLHVQVPPEKKVFDPASLKDAHAMLMEAKYFPTPDLFREVVRRFQNETDEWELGWLWSALGEFPPGQDRSVLKLIVQEAVQLLSRPGRSAGNAEWGALAFLEHQLDEPVFAFRQLAQTAPNMINRSSALKKLRPLDPDTARRLAIDAIATNDDWLITEAGAEVLGKLGENSGDLEFVWLLRSVPADSRALSAIAKALLAIGGPDALAAAEQLVPRLEMSIATAVREASRGVSRQEAARRFLEAGVFTGPEVQGGLQVASQPDNEDGEQRGSWTRPFLHGTGLYFVFDTESVDVPPRYDQLLQDFADHSGGAFDPEAITQSEFDEGDTDEGPVRVQFISDNRLYRFEPDLNGDWIDVPAITAAVNRALDDAGTERRFIPLRAEGQVVELVFVPPQAFAHVASALGWAITSDPGTAARMGQDYEEYVRRTLGY